MTPTRLLMIVHGHPAERPGGAEVYAWELYQSLKHHPGWDTTILTRTARQPEAGGPPVWLDDLDPRHYWLHQPADDYDMFYHEARSLGATAPWTDRLLRRLAPDVVHIQHTFHIGLDLLRRIREVLPQARIIYTLHEFMPICYHRGILFKTRERSPCHDPSPEACHRCFPGISPSSFGARRYHILKRLSVVDRFIAPSRFLQDRFVEFGIAPERIVVEDYGRLPGPPPAASPSQVRNCFGFFGQINPFKGVDVLLSAVRILASRQVSVLLQIHGANLAMQPPPFQQRFHELLAQAQRVGTVTDCGPYTAAELPARLQGVDWVVVPSIWFENSPLVIQEAFQAGRPVLASNLGALPEKVRHGVDGLLFTADDPEALAATLEAAIPQWATLQAAVRPPYAMADHHRKLLAIYAGAPA